MISLICVILKKKSHRKKDQICDYQRQEFGGGGWLENWMKVVKSYKHPFYTWKTNKYGGWNVQHDGIVNTGLQDI